MHTQRRRRHRSQIRFVRHRASDLATDAIDFGGILRATSEASTDISGRSVQIEHRAEPRCRQRSPQSARKISRDDAAFGRKNGWVTCEMHERRNRISGKRIDPNDRYRRIVRTVRIETVRRDTLARSFAE